jgi:hypothetical protein
MLNYKFIITLLSSNNSELLKLSYNSILNQINHNIDYTIILIINSLDKDYYNDVKKEFQNIDIDIIETKSNGKPGMGHNSCLNYFYKNKIYDYLIMIDGDDLVYPTFLSQISKAFEYKNNLDILSIYGNDSLRCYYDSDISDIHIMNNFYLRPGHFLPKKFHDSNWLINPFRSDIIKNGIINIIRILLFSRNFINLNHNIEIYSEKCYILDDYIAYLNYIDNVLNKNMSSLIINSDGLYLYNNLNNNSVSLKYKEKFNLDYKTILDYKDTFIYLDKQLGNTWNLDKLEYKILSLPYDKETLNIIQKSNTYTINIDDIYIKKNYIYMIDFATNFISQYYNLCINKINYYLFTNLNEQTKIKAFDLCDFLIKNNIHDRRLFIYISILYFYNNDTHNFIKYFEKSDYYINKYSNLYDYYKTQKNPDK